MKTDIHPTYQDEVTVKCACGSEFTTGSTKESLSIEICSECHPFYTGKQKFIDTAQRLKKFEDRQKKVEAAAAAHTEAQKRRAKKAEEDAEADQKEK